MSKEMRNMIDNFKRLIKEAEDNLYIEVSCAALASIEIDGRFLLFREKLKFQPIGGGLKYYDSALPFLESIDFKTDRTDNDIRIKIPKIKWEEFKNWFESGEDRETSIKREIDEELAPFASSEITDEMNSDDFFMKEVITEKYRIFQIHRVTFPEHIKEAIIELVDSNDRFKLATPEEIMNPQEHSITDHSINILI
jgi:hypothetical protein